jgi:hypothetical protein
MTQAFSDLPLKDQLALALGAAGPFYVSGEDNFRISAICSAAAVVVTVAGRVLGCDGVSRPFEHQLFPTSNRVITTLLRAIGEGWIQQFVVYASSGAPSNGQCWVKVEVVRGITGGTVAIGVLAAGAITSQQPLMFPGSPLRNPMDSPGFIRSITGTNPAAGVEISETVPAAARWRVIHFTARLVTDATVANRAPILLVDDGVNTLFAADPAAVQTASLNRRWNAGEGTERLALVSDNVQWGWPRRTLLLAGYRIMTVTNNIVAGDNWGAPQLLVEEWLEGVA